MGDSELFEQVYEDSNSVVLTLTIKGNSVALGLKAQGTPVLDQGVTVWASRTGGRKYVINCGFGEEEYDEDDLPNPIKKLIASGGGGPNGEKVSMPPIKALIRPGYLIRPYPEYCSDWVTRNSGKVHDKPMPEILYYQIAKLYLKLQGVPLYL
jgi:hypothetical protein